MFSGSACYFVFQQVVFQEVKKCLGEQLQINPTTEAVSKAQRITKLHSHVIKSSKHITKALLGVGALHPDLTFFLLMSVWESLLCSCSFHVHLSNIF